MVEELKMKYNYILNRYYNGCDYVEKNPSEFKKYIDKIMELKNELDNLIMQIEEKQKISEDEILGGFKIC